MVYKAIVDGSAETERALERYLILNVAQTEINNEIMRTILADIDVKKKYKHVLLDYLVHIISNTLDSQGLHQEIARYLGVDKQYLNKIHTTADGTRVRSKSEVIISDLLYKNGIKYTYEKKLFYSGNQWILPDYTIHLAGKTFYWEHLGMLGKEDYDQDWLRKLNIYNSCFPDLLIKTYESGVLAQDAEKIIEQIKKY